MTETVPPPEVTPNRPAEVFAARLILMLLSIPSQVAETGFRAAGAVARFGENHMKDGPRKESLKKLAETLERMLTQQKQVTENFRGQKT